MKNLTFYLLIALMSITVASCNTKQKDTKTEETPKTEVTNETKAPKSDVKATHKAGEPIHLTTEEFKKLVANYDTDPNEWKYLGDKPCIVDFWATWCPPCKAIAPVLKELASEYKDDIYIYEVDVDKNKELAGVFGIQSIPTLLFIPMNGQPESSVGAVPKATLKDKIDNFLLK